MLECIFTKKQDFTGERDTRQEATFPRKISRNERLQTKSSEKEHVDAPSQT